MSLISPAFVGFICAVILIYYCLPKRFQWIVLLCASLFFYCANGLSQVVFVLVINAIAWLTGLKISGLYEEASAVTFLPAQGKDRKTAQEKGQNTAQEKGQNTVQEKEQKSVQAEEKKTVQAEDQKAAKAAKRAAMKEAKRKAKLWLIAGIILLVILFIISKSGARIINKIAALSGGEPLDLSFLTALGISYYTFSLIGYMADLYWRRAVVQKNYCRLLAFTVFFPKILQGPIAQYKTLGLQLFEPHKFNYQDFTYSLQRFCWGYFKKMVIADRMLVVVNAVYGQEAPAGSLVIVGTILSALQVYCDFSGCMDIVIGISQTFGITMDENFRQPFFSRSATEFWKRWHSTLGTWFKDYIYVPLALSSRVVKAGRYFRSKMGVRMSTAVMTIIPTYAAWILSGLWHGLASEFLAWGLMWATIITLSNVFAPELRNANAALHVKTESYLWTRWQMLRTFCFFCLSRLLTAPGSLVKSWTFIKRIFTSFQPGRLADGTLLTLGLDIQNLIVAAAAFFLVYLVDRLQADGIDVRARIAQLPIVFRWIIYLAMVFTVLVFGIYGPKFNVSEFVYAKF